MLTLPLKPTGFDFCVLQRCSSVFVFKSSQHFFHSFEDFRCLNMMSHDASCVDTMTYFDRICVFDYCMVLPTKGFNSNIERLRTALWPNVNFKLYIVFSNVVVPSCDTWNVWFCMLSDLAGILFDGSKFWCGAVEWLADKMVGSRSHFLKLHIRLEMSRFIRTCAWRYTLPSCFLMFSCLSL